MLAAACGGSAPETFDLSAASVPEVHKLRAQIAIREPVTSLDLDSQRILVRTSPETVAYLTGAQWSDRLPTLIQTRLVQTFQNAHLSGSVGRAGAGFSSNYSLELDIRAFELDAKSVQANCRYRGQDRRRSRRADRRVAHLQDAGSFGGNQRRAGVRCAERGIVGRHDANRRLHRRSDVSGARRLVAPGGGSSHPPRRVGEHRIDLAGVGQQIGARLRAVAVVLADLGEQAFELLRIALDRVAELRIGAAAPADFVEGLLALRRVEAAREGVIVAAPPAIPHFRRRIRVDQTGDADGDGVERVGGRTIGAAGPGAG